MKPNASKRRSFLLLVVLTSSAASALAGACEELASGAAIVPAVIRSDPQIANSPAYGDFRFDEIVRANGSKVIPRSIKESNCYLALVLRRNVTEILVSVANDSFSSSGAESSEEQLDRFVENANVRLSQVIMGDRAPAIAFTLLSGAIQERYELKSGGRGKRTAIQKALRSLGIARPSYGAMFLLLSHLEAAGATEIPIEALRRALRD